MPDLSGGNWVRDIGHFVLVADLVLCIAYEALPILSEDFVNTAALVRFLVVWETLQGTLLSCTFQLCCTNVRYEH